MRILPLVALSPLLLACRGALVHPVTDPTWLDPMTGRASVALTERAATESEVRVALYGDTRDGRERHRAVVDAIRGEHPDLVLFSGDALSCFPVGHMPDFGGWQYAVPVWPQVHRGYPISLVGSIVPFPALLHQTVGAPFVMTRDPHGWNAFLEDTAGLRLADRVPMLFVPGNHDTYHRHDRELLARLFSPSESPTRDADHLYFSVDLAGYRIVVLDTGDDLFGSRSPFDDAQRAWLDATLSEAERQGRSVVVALHLPPFSSAREDGPVPWVADEVVRGVLDRHRVALVVTGHAHAYERIERPGKDARPVTYVVSGGGGAPFHHEDKGAVDPGSRAFVEGALHFVMLELAPRRLRVRFVPVGAYTGPVDDVTLQP